MHTIQVNPALWPTSAVEIGKAMFIAGEVYEVDETEWANLEKVEIWAGEDKPRLPAFAEVKKAAAKTTTPRTVRAPRRAKAKTSK